MEYVSSKSRLITLNLHEFMFYPHSLKLRQGLRNRGGQMERTVVREASTSPRMRERPTTAGNWEDDENELRRIDPGTGEVLEKLSMPPEVGVSGLESDECDQFFCGGGPSGKVRAVRRPKK